MSNLSGLQEEKMWVIFGNKDHTEVGMTSYTNWTYTPQLRRDTDGKPMKILKTVGPTTYAGARKAYEQFFEEK
jgi:hypothetical protein